MLWSLICELFEIILSFAFFSILTLFILNVHFRFYGKPFFGNPANRFMIFFMMLIGLYLLFLKKGAFDIFPGVFAQFFLIYIRNKELQQLCERCLVITIPLHLSLSEKTDIESVIYVGVLLILSLFLVEWLRLKKYGVWHLHPFLLLFYMFDPALAFWGACLSFYLLIFYTLDFLVGKRKEMALQALAYLSLLLLFIVYFYFEVVPTNLLIPGLLHYFNVKTFSELLLLCGFSLMGGAIVIFAIVSDEWSGWFPVRFYFLICMGLTLFSIIYHATERDKWLPDLFFISGCFIIYWVTVRFVIPKSVKETIPYFFGGLGLYYSKLFILLSPGMQSWVLGLGGLTLLVNGTQQFLLRSCREDLGV